MRVAIYVAAVAALAACDPTGLRGAIASAAAVMLECAPYLCAARALAPVLQGRAHALLAYAGCGCSGGPSARSTPAAVAAAFLFGPAIAVARVALATLSARLVPAPPACDRRDSLLHDVASLAPAAILAAMAATYAPAIAPHAPWFAQIAIGAAFGLALSPCALGGVAFAASLHVHAPVAAYAVLCTTGMVDTRRWLPQIANAGEDAAAYAVLAATLALVAWQRGYGFVHPALAIALVPCAFWCQWCAWSTRASRHHSSRVVATALFVAVVAGAPSPTYRATETTLRDAFPGETLDFTGVYMRSGNTAIVERYAITCCRADAAPVAVALEHALPIRIGTWTRVHGTIARTYHGLVLRVARYDLIAPPHDPFIYR